MSKSPVKFVGAAARTISGGSRGGYNTSNILADQRYAGVLGNKREKARRKAKLLAAQKISRKNASIGYVDKLRAGARKVALNTQGNELAETAPAIETNNTIDNVTNAQDRSQMRDTGELSGVTALAGFSTMSSDVLDPMSQQTPSIDNSLQPQVPTYGVAGAAEAMFGTPMQRQMSMGSSLMKRACKYKNKK
jgi:hypothetical protein